MQWFYLKLFRTTDPGPADDLPIYTRSTVIEFAKKALSSFMPNRLPAWDPITKSGNPTKSTQINEVIRYVKRQEVRRLGAPNMATRALRKEEFEEVMVKLNTLDDIKKRFMVPAALKFQFSMIGRVDDTCHFKEEDLKPNPQFPQFTLLARMRWSKNVMEERDAPDQLLLGANDPKYCVLFGFALYLEVWYEQGSGLNSPYIFGGNDNPKNTKSLVYHTLKRDVWDGRTSAEGKLGTHSFRKFPASFARRNGCSKDDVDSRGCWRKRRVSDRYVEVNIPYPDAKVAAVLAMGGPVRYGLNNGSGITETWLLENVVPNICRSVHLQQQVALVLALPLLWAAFDDSMIDYMPGTLRNCICTAYNMLEDRLQDGQHPVRKSPLVVTGYDDQVHIDELVDG